MSSFSIVHCQGLKYTNPSKATTLIVMLAVIIPVPNLGPAVNHVQR